MSFQPVQNVSPLLLIPQQSQDEIYQVERTSIPSKKRASLLTSITVVKERQLSPKDSNLRMAAFGYKPTLNKGMQADKVLQELRQKNNQLDYIEPIGIIMESRLKNTVLQLRDQSYIHFSRIVKYNRYYSQVLFTNKETGKLYQVLFFSRSSISLSGLEDQLHRSLKLFQTLNYKKVTPVVDFQEKSDSYIVISKGYEHSLADLVGKRQGLTDYEAAYFLGDLSELLGYLKNRQVFFQKIEADDIYLTQDLKITIGFNLYLGTVESEPMIKNLPFRHQIKNRNVCPDLFFIDKIQLTHIDSLNSWTTGLLLYFIMENKLPFLQSNDDLIGKARGRPEKQVEKLLENQYRLNFQISKQFEFIDLVRKLLNPVSRLRLKFQLAVVSPFIRLFPTPPHILPSTVFSCPPSETYKQQFFRRFKKEQKCTQMPVNTTHSKFKSQKDFKRQFFSSSSKKILTEKHLDTDRTLSQNLPYIQDFVDISNVFGYGYQMNTGILSFVFNDETEYMSLGGNQIRVKGQKKGQDVVYTSEKLPEEDDIRKKITILQSFGRNIKRRKLVGDYRDRLVSVQNYCKTKYASLFLLTNDSVQVIFNDKLAFVMTRNDVFYRTKNQDQFDRFNPLQLDEDIKLRKHYASVMASKMFLWQQPNQKEDQF